MDRLVVRLDAAVRRAAAQILERREPDLWILAVGGRVAFSNRRIPINEAPALEIDVVHQVVVPGGLDRGLVGKHQHLPRSEESSVGKEGVRTCRSRWEA